MNRRQLILSGIGAAMLRFFPAWAVEPEPEPAFELGEWKPAQVVDLRTRPIRDGEFLIPPELMRDLIPRLRTSLYRKETV